MHFGCLMLANQTFSAAVRDRFREGEVMNLLFNFFEGCNEGIMGKETDGKGSTLKWEGNAVRRG